TWLRHKSTFMGTSLLPRDGIQSSTGRSSCHDPSPFRIHPQYGDATSSWPLRVVDGSREIHAVEHSSNNLMTGWSPDGKWFLFASDRSGSMDLWGLPFGDGNPQGAPVPLRVNIPVAQQIQPMGVTQSGAL